MSKPTVWVPIRNDRLINDINSNQPFPKEFLYGLENAQDYQVKFIMAPRASGSFISYYVEKIFSRIFKLGLPFEVIWQLRNTVKSEDLVVCVNDPVANAVLLGKKLGLLKNKTIAIYQSIGERRINFKFSNLFSFVFNLFINKADHIFVLSEAAQNYLLKNFNVNHARVSVFRFGVDTVFWEKSNISYSKRDYILTLGNDMNRDFSTFQKAVEKLDSSIKVFAITNFQFNSNRIKKLTNISHIELKQIIQGAKLLVIPSIKIDVESSGLSSALQGISCGTSVLVSNAAHFHEILEEKKDFLTFDPENADSLKNQIEKIYSQDIYLNEISDRAHAKISQKYTIKDMNIQMNEIIKNVIKA